MRKTAVLGLICTFTNLSKRVEFIDDYHLFWYPRGREEFPPDNSCYFYGNSYPMTRSWTFKTPGGHFTAKNTGAWLNSLGSGILVGKIYFGVLQKIDLDDS